MGARVTAARCTQRSQPSGAQALLGRSQALRPARCRRAPSRTEGVTYAPKIAKAEAHIDWTSRRREIERQVRAFNPWPVAETRFEGEQLRIYDARALACKRAQAPAIPARSLPFETDQC